MAQYPFFSYDLKQNAFLLGYFSEDDLPPRLPYFLFLSMYFDKTHINKTKNPKDESSQLCLYYLIVVSLQKSLQFRVYTHAHQPILTVIPQALTDFFFYFHYFVYFCARKPMLQYMDRANIYGKRQEAHLVGSCFLCCKKYVHWKHIAVFNYDIQENFFMSNQWQTYFTLIYLVYIVSFQYATKYQLTFMIP